MLTMNRLSTRKTTAKSPARRGGRAGRGSPATASRRLHIEPLEDRRLLSVLVSNINDSGAGSLRAAIATANSSATPTTITFDPTVFASAQTITLTSGVLALSNSSQPTTIDLPAAGLTIAGNYLEVNPNTTATLLGTNPTNLTNLTMTGGLCNYGALTLQNETIAGNTANDGGVWNAGQLHMTNVVVSGNKGDGIVNGLGGTMWLTDVVVSANTDGGTYSGAGIYNDGTATLKDTTISGNTATGNGAGIYNDSAGIATLTNVTIANNVAGSAGVSSQGGGIYNAGSITLTNATIVDNTAPCGASNSQVYGGGGIFNSVTGTVSLTNVTISGNAASNGVGTGSGGGGIANVASAAHVTIGNTIVAGNSADNLGPDGLGSFTSVGSNLIGTTDDSTGWSGADLTGTIASPLVPGLATTLANNGGLTGPETLALLTGSPAIDAGNNALIPPGITTDERGLPARVAGSGQGGHRRV